MTLLRSELRKRNKQATTLARVTTADDLPFTGADLIPYADPEDIAFTGAD